MFAEPSTPHANASAHQQPSDNELYGLVVEADEQCLSEGLAPKQRGMKTVSKVMTRLGYLSFVMAGAGASPMVQRILAIHRSLYRPSDLAVGGIHGGIFMFRDVFARISIPFGYGTMAIDPFQLTDLSDNQLRWLGSRPHDVDIFLDQFIDIFDFAGTLGRLGDYKSPPKEARQIFRLASFQLQAAAAALTVAFDFRGAVQSSLIGAELSLKAGLAAQGADQQARRKHGHNLVSAAKAFGQQSQAFDLDRVLKTIERLPQYVENRYSAEQPNRVAVGHIVMGSQFIAGEVSRRVAEYSIRSAINPPIRRAYP